MQSSSDDLNSRSRVLPQFDVGTSYPSLSSRLMDTSTRRGQLPPHPLEPSASHFPSLSYPVSSAPSSSDLESDKRKRQLPGLHELLSPGVRGETTAPGRYANLTTTNQPRPAHSDLHNSFRRPASWSQLPSGSNINGPSYGPTTPTSLDHASQALRRDTGSLYAMPPPTTAPSTLHPFARQGAQSLNLAANPHDMRASIHRPSIGFSDSGTADPRRDSVRSNSFAAGASECVGQRQIPGKGLCYVYNDGNTCPTVIDGEVVNPMWGTTKAGKARKRLAQACLACREKKIRCEPRHPRCLQCEKSKRECVMPSTQPTQIDSDNASSLSSTSLSVLSPAPAHQQQQNSQFRSGSHLGPALKRPRSAEKSPLLTPSTVSGDSSPYPSASSTSNDSGMAKQPPRDVYPVAVPAKNSPLTSATKTESIDANSWNTDPFEVDANATMRLLDMFYAQHMTMNNRIYPRSTFERWIRDCRSKSQDELMLLYSLLALGSAFGKDEGTFGTVCAERAGKAVAAKFGRFSLPLIQSRLFLGVYHHAQGRNDLFWEYGGAMLRALSAENLNTEEGCVQQSSSSMFGLNEEQFKECKRRTFWAAFVLDRMAAFCTYTFNHMPARAIHLRYPCPDDDYDDGMRSRAPFFRWPMATTTDLDTNDCMPSEAFQFSIYQLLSDVVELVASNVHQSHSRYARIYEREIPEIYRQLADWRNNLPVGIQNSFSDPHRSMELGQLGVAANMFALFHLSHLHLARFARHSLLSKDQIRHGVTAARTHASHILQIAGILCSFAQTLGEGQNLHQMISPILGYAMFIAIDTVTAGGHATELEAILISAMDGLNVLQVIGYAWNSCKLQSKLVEKRIEDIQVLTQQSRDRTSTTTHDGDRGWRMGLPLEVYFEPDYDVMFGLESATFFETLREDG